MDSGCSGSYEQKLKKLHTSGYSYPVLFLMNYSLFVLIHLPFYQHQGSELDPCLHQV